MRAFAAGTSDVMVNVSRSIIADCWAVSRGGLAVRSPWQCNHHPLDVGVSHRERILSRVGHVALCSNVELHGCTHIGNTWRVKRVLLVVFLGAALG